MKEREKAKREREIRMAKYEEFLSSKGIDWKEDMDAAILALTARENVLAAVIFYKEKSGEDMSLGDIRAHVEKLCLSNGVSTELRVRFGHTSLLAATAAQ